MTTRLILARHGESVWNGERRIQGSQDPALSHRGRQQAERLAAGLRGHVTKRVGAVYTSPLRRAVETAERIAEVWQLPLVREPDLREVCLGKWEGMTVAEIGAAFPGAYERWLQDPLVNPAPGGENLGVFSQRVIGAFERMRAAQGGGDCLLVSHGGVIKLLLCHFLGLHVRSLFRIKQDNTAINLVEVDGGVHRVVLVNDTCHLSRAGTDLAPRDVLTDEAGVADPAF